MTLGKNIKTGEFVIDENIKSKQETQLLCSCKKMNGIFTKFLENKEFSASLKEADEYFKNIVETETRCLNDVKDI